MPAGRVVHQSQVHAELQQFSRLPDHKICRIPCPLRLQRDLPGRSRTRMNKKDLVQSRLVRAALQPSILLIRMPTRCVSIDMKVRRVKFARSVSIVHSLLHVEDTDAHRQSAQHQRIANLQAGDAGASAGNYSRTPELRVSHKLAERKRRSEMKDLFETLNRAIPNSPGNKSSKWEILSKGNLNQLRFCRRTKLTK